MSLLGIASPSLGIKNTMRTFSIPASLLYTVALLLTSSSASPVQSELPEIEEDLSQTHNVTLVPRCDYPCGYSGQICCPGPGLCYTNSLDQAACADSPGEITQASSPTTAAGNGYWQTYTSTWVETGLVTRTSVYSEFVGVTAASTPTATGVQCDWAAGQSLCGTICCASGQYCAVVSPPQCSDAGNGGYTTAGIGGGYTVGPGGTYSAPLRPTTGTFVTSTATVSPTTTVPFIAPVATGSNMTSSPVEESSGGGGGLSGGAIAGIVIGVLLGLALLALLCFCCIVRGLWAVVAGIFGLGRKKKTVVEETYVSEHHSSGGGGGRVWYGDKPARPEREKKGFGGWGAVAAGLGALGLGLAGKRALDKRRDRRARSEVSSDYYYSDYYYSDSSK